MDTNVYLEMLSAEIGDLGKWTNGMAVKCHEHGDIKYYNYDAHIPWSAIEELVDEHLHSMHYA